ncbi:MAG: hypothetical protein L3J82_01930 [Planctomycetes bacterium]|nr:hypothetical protein [Planctomycetota bacterium]
MRLLLLLMLMMLGCDVAASEPDEAFPDIEEDKASSWRKDGRLPLLIDFAWDYKTDFDSEHWTGPDLMLRGRFDDLFGGFEGYQLVLHSTYKKGWIDGDLAEHFLITTGFSFGNDFGAGEITEPWPAGEWTISKPFPMARSTIFSVALGAALGYSSGLNTSKSADRQEAVVLEAWQSFGMYFLEFRLREVIRINLIREIGIEADIHFEINVFRPIYPLSVTIGVSWLDYQRSNGAFFEIGVRLAL